MYERERERERERGDQYRVKREDGWAGVVLAGDLLNYSESDCEVGLSHRPGGGSGEERRECNN